MDRIEYTGEFFLPGREKKYPGRVVGDEERNELILEIYGNETIEGNEIEKNILNSNLVYHHQIILGNTTHPQNITLLKCKWHGTKQIGKSIFIVSYRIETIILNALIKSNSELKFDYITISIPYVSSWYDDWPSTNKFLISPESKGEETNSISINNNLSINFIDFTSSNSLEFGKVKETNTKKYVQFKYVNGEHFDVIISDVVRFTKLLEFSLSEQIHFKLIDSIIKKRYTIASDTNFSDLDTVYILFKNFFFVHKQDVDKHYIHQNKMLISRDGLGKNQLNNVIANWFINKAYYHIYDFYLDSNNWFEGTGAVLSNVMFNNRFLNLIQALEDYHRKTNEVLNPDKAEFDKNKKEVLKLLNKKSSLKKWANDRLNYNKLPSLKERIESLIRKSDDITSKLFEDKNIFKNFPQLAKKYRNFLSHGDLKGTFQGEELHKLFFMAQVLLAIFILKSLKLKNGTILSLMEGNIDNNKRINEIKIRQNNIQKQ